MYVTGLMSLEDAHSNPAHVILVGSVVFDIGHKQTILNPTHIFLLDSLLLREDDGAVRMCVVHGHSLSPNRGVE